MNLKVSRQLHGEDSGGGLGDGVLQLDNKIPRD